MKSLASCAFLLLCFIFSQTAFANPIPVKLDDAPSLSLRVLTRPMAVLYQDASESIVLNSNLPTFQPFFVYFRPGGEDRESGQGWYQVGTDENGTVVGWIKTEDVFEWKQTMCVYYTHPQGRNPVLMFDFEDQLESLISAAPADRTEELNRLYSAIENSAKGLGSLPMDFPVISMEPKMAVDMMEQFYLLPILEHEVIEIDGREGRLLYVAAAAAGGQNARSRSDIRDNAQFAQAAVMENSTASGQLQDLKIDFIWVIDTTRSMGPYIEATRQTILETSRKLAGNPELKERISFGVWGFRDSDHVPGLEYNTHNFTPDLLAVDAFADILGHVQETSVDSGSFDENVFAGMADAVNNTNWRDGAMRVICLVGDAPGHSLDNERNTSGLDADTLRILANDAKITIFALHINPERTRSQNRTGRLQFSAMSTNPGTELAMYWPITADKMDEFSAAASMISSEVVRTAELALQGAMIGQTSDPAVAAATTGGLDVQAIGGALQAATVTWLGNAAQAEPPRDVEAWVVDKDLANPLIQSLEVRLLLNKRQLDNISTLLTDVIAAGRTSQMDSEDFFTSLQSTSAIASRDPDLLSAARSLGESGLVADFLIGLPYHSQLMDMSNELWASWGPDEQDQFINSLDAKLRAYAAIHDDPGRWILLNVGDEPADAVTPLSLELLP